jgi:hypothetical protein
MIVNTVELLILIMTCFRSRERRAVPAGVKAKLYGWPAASLDPSCARRGLAAVGSRSWASRSTSFGDGNLWRGLSGLSWKVGYELDVSPYSIRKRLAIEHVFE